MSLNNKAMIVTLNVSCWTARKQDRRVAQEVDAAHNAKDAGRYNKLLIDKKYLDPLTSHAGAIRQYHYKMTLPWMDNGSRLLPSKLFMEYRNGLDQLKTKFEILINNFIVMYDHTLVQDARMRLGTLYDPSDYPPGSELRAKFGVETDILPVPSGADFRVDVANSEVARIQEEITRRVNERQKQAMQEAWTRVREVVSTIYERTSADKAVIRESLMDNATELVRLLPGLNISDDPAMTLLTAEITDKLLVDVWSLRNSKSTRLRVADAAQSILAKIP